MSFIFQKFRFFRELTQICILSAFLVFLTGISPGNSTVQDLFDDTLHPINYADRPMASQLRHIFKKNDLKQIQTIFEKKDFSNFRDDYDNNILHFAVLANDEVTINPWLEKYSNNINKINILGSPPIKSAIDSDSAISVYRLLVLGAKLDIVSIGNTDIVEFCEGVIREIPDHASCQLVVNYKN